LRPIILGWKIPTVLTICTLIALVITTWLGLWQLSRLQEKQARRAQNHLSLTSSPLNWESFTLNRPAYGQKIRIRNCVLKEKKARYFFFYGRSDGFRWIAICQADRDLVLVDLGWAPLSDQNKNPTVNTIDLTGVWRQFDGRGFRAETKNSDFFYWRDPEGLEMALGSAFRKDGFVVVDLSQTKPDLGLTQMPLTFELPNRHLEYALTWFSMGLILFAFYVALVIKLNKDKTS
jgi:surfeit locus 1 family protein